MNLLSKILLRGVSIWPLLLAGLLIAFLSSRRKTTTSRQAMEYDLLIQKIVQGNGYSPAMARMIAAVARHETGNYKSPLFLNHNNFFGMKAAKKRPHYQDYVAKGNLGYAGFNSPANSVRDFVMYLNYVGYPWHFDSVTDLVETMKSHGYFEAPLSEYINGVERALPKVAYV